MTKPYDTMDAKHRTLLTEICAHINANMQVKSSEGVLLQRVKTRVEVYIANRFDDNMNFDETSREAWKFAYHEIATHAIKSAEQS